MEQKRNMLAGASVAVSMAMFGTLSVFVRNIPLSSGALALCRAVMAAVLMGAVLLVKGQKIAFGELGRDLVLLLISGLVLGVNWILFFESYRYTTVSIATLSYYAAPAIVTAICPLIFREKLTKRQLLCFLGSTCGVVLIIGASGFTGTRDLTGILFGLGAAVLYATVVVLNKMLRNVGGLQRTFLQMIVAAITLVPYVLLTGGVGLTQLDMSGWVNLLIVGIVLTGVTYCMYFSALPHLRGQHAAILSYLDPLVAVIMSVTVLREPITVLQIVGGVLVLGFSLLNELKETA